LGRLLSLIEAMSMTKRLLYMPLISFIFTNAKYLSSTSYTLAEVPKPMRKGKKHMQKLLWTLLLVYFGPVNWITFTDALNFDSSRNDKNGVLICRCLPPQNSPRNEKKIFFHWFLMGFIKEKRNGRYLMQQGSI
jgi:hypothetical protein